MDWKWPQPRGNSTRSISQDLLVLGSCAPVESHERDAPGQVVCAQKGTHGLHGDAAGPVARIAVHSGADGRKGDRLQSVVGRNLQGVAIAGCKELVLPISAPVPNGADCVYHVTRGQPMPTGDLGLPRRTSAEATAFFEQSGTGCAVDGPVHAAATQKGTVRGVDDRIHVQACDVACYDFHSIPYVHPALRAGRPRKGQTKARRPPSKGSVAAVPPRPESAPHMALLVQKFGGTSVGTTDLIRNVANRIKSSYDEGHQMVIVVSAMGKSTDDLIELARRVNSRPSHREMDMLLSTGEQVSIALLAMALEHSGVPARSFTGGQVRIRTDARHSEARIQEIDTARLRADLRAGRVCIVAGFQGVSEGDEITTLGRGGSDTTAVALAAALSADSCEIFTDVDGVYTTDPNKVRSARKIPRISYEEMLELARLGAGVLHSRSVELASKYNVPLIVRSSFNNAPGTIVLPEEQVMEKVVVRGVSLKTDEARVSVMDIPDRPGLAAVLFTRLAESNVNVDVIVQSTGKDARNTIAFTVPEGSLLLARQVVEGWLKEIGSGSIDVNERIAIVSAVGVGMKSHSGIAAKMFGALAARNINIEMISTSEIKISVVVHPDQGRAALEAVHEAFELDKAPGTAG